MRSKEKTKKNRNNFRLGNIVTIPVAGTSCERGKDLREVNQRSKKLGLTNDDVAFYDAIEVNDSAVAVLGDETLRLIAQELVKAARSSITIDWTVRENVQAQMRVNINRILRKYGYPPNKRAHATELVLEQAEVLCRDWTE